MSTVQASVKGFVHSVRAEEQNSDTATTEFADNSIIDADATELDIQKKTLTDGKTYLAFRDNGTGIDDDSFGKLSKLYDTVKTGNNSLCGEFGVGVPAAALYLGDKTFIVSKGHSNGFSEIIFSEYNRDSGVGSSYVILIKEIFGEYDENSTYVVIRLIDMRIPDFDDLDEYRRFIGSIYSEKLSNDTVSVSVNGVVVVPQKFISDDSIIYRVTIICKYIKIDDNKGLRDSVNWFQPIEMTNKDGTKTDILTQDLFENGKPGRILKKVDEPKEEISDIIEFDVIIDKKIYSHSEGTNGFMISTTNMRNSTQLPIPSKRGGSSVVAEDIKKSRIQLNIPNEYLNKQSNKSRQYHNIETNFNKPYIYSVVQFLFQKRVNELKKNNKKKADAAILANTTNSHTKSDDEQIESIDDDEQSQSIDDGEQNQSIDDGEHSESIDDGEQNQSIDDDEQNQSIDDEHSESIDNDENDVPIVVNLPNSHSRHVSESVHNRFTKSRVESIFSESIPTYINNLPDNEKEEFETKLCRAVFKMCWQKYKHGQGIDDWLYTTAVQTGFQNLTNSYLLLLWDKLPGDDVIGGAILKDFIDDNMTFIE
jgi:hypothetical protein